MPEMTVEKTKDYLVVKIPLKAVEEGRAEVSSHARRVIDAAIVEGLRDLKAGRVFGPFKSVQEFKKTLSKTKSKR